MNQEANSQEITTTNYSTCSCHIINPKVHRLILWPNLNKETGITEYTLRIGSQRFASLANTDKLGQTYWRFQCAGVYEDGQETITNETVSSMSEQIKEITNN